jgi:hypothetical protein
MKLVLKRIAKKSNYTIGKLYVDGTYFCDTLEDTDRGLSDSMKITEIQSKKVYGETAIPTGVYDVTLNVYSPKFGAKSFYKEVCNGYLPRLLNVKGFDGILIHSGNKPTDTLGCILVGENKAVGQVLNSQTTFKKLYTALKQAVDNGDSITIRIE